MAMLWILSAQDKLPSSADGASFFSGTVVELDQEKLTVTRVILGKDPEKKTFLINADTRIDGKLRAKSRVTVRFASSDQGDVALSIVVREKTDKKKKP